MSKNFLEMLQKCLIILLRLSLVAKWVQSDCDVRIEENAPRLEKHFGSSKIVLSKNLRSIRIDQDETILAYCSSNIRLRVNNLAYIDFSDSIAEITLKCSASQQIIYQVSENGIFSTTTSYFYEPVTLTCSSESEHQLYESYKTLPNCENYLSYGIGTTVGSERKQLRTETKNIVIAAICYDLNALKLKYATYFAYRPKYGTTSDKHYFINPPVGLDEKLNKHDIYILISFMTQLSFNASQYLIKNNEDLLQLFDFDYVNLIQDAPLEKPLSHYENLFNIIWWRNLRLGNWRNFLNIFEQHTKAAHYMVYTGTSGVVQIPTTACNKTRPLTIASDEAVVNVPEYIWSYLIPMPENGDSGFVVVGYNSPYSTHFHSSPHQNRSIIFCEDMCNEISWLQSNLFGTLRLIPAMGLMFCCHPEEARLHLSNFPYDAIPRLSLTGPTTSTSGPSTPAPAPTLASYSTTT